MKVAVVFAGILRTDLNETIENIYKVCSNFKNCDVKNYFVTWSVPDTIKDKIQDNVDFFYMVEEPKPDWVCKHVPNFKNHPKTKPPVRGASYLNIFYMLKCRQIALKYLNSSNFLPDYVLLIRNDTYLRMNNIKEWYNDMYNTSLQRHVRESEHGQFDISRQEINDHFVFAKYDIVNTVFNQNDEYIKQYIAQSHNAEGVIFNLINNNNIGSKQHSLDLNDYYLLDGVNGNRHVYRSNNVSEED